MDISFSKFMLSGIIRSSDPGALPFDRGLKHQFFLQKYHLGDKVNVWWRELIREKLCKDIVLVNCPGKDSVNLEDKVTVEGRVLLHTE
ncbi:hypothetical protein OROGR_028953 [Orobanche gracilis]